MTPDTHTQQPPLRRQRRVYRSRLDRHRAELVAQHQAGASLAQLRHWLRMACRIRVERSTIARALARWPEAGRDA